MLLTACSTYVPVYYRTPSEYPAIRDSHVSISLDKNSSIPSIVINELGQQINHDGWLKYKKEKGPKPVYEIVIHKFNTSSEAKPASTETTDKRTYRTASYRAIGSASFSIKKRDEDAPTMFEISTNTIVASRVELPDILGAYSRVSVFSTLMGSNSEAGVIEKQDTELSLEALKVAKLRLLTGIMNKFTPNKNSVNIKLEDDREDMDDLKVLLKEQDYTGAVIYLDYLNAKDKRSDVFYNLGVVYEALGYFQEACAYYKYAFEMNAKDFYEKERINCEVRLKNFYLLPQ